MSEFLLLARRLPPSEKVHKDQSDPFIFFSCVQFLLVDLVSQGLVYLQRSTFMLQADQYYFLVIMFFLQAEQSISSSNVFLQAYQYYFQAIMYFYTSRLVLFLGNNVFSIQAYHYYFQAIMYFLQANYYYFPCNNVFSIQADQFFFQRNLACFWFTRHQNH